MLQIIDLVKNYGSYQALKGLNLSVNKGEVFCLLGQNGAGKTTTINLALGFLEPTSGKVLIKGAEVAKDPLAARRNIAYIPEVVLLYGVLSALENLDYFSKLAGFNYSRKQLSAFLTNANLQAAAHTKRVESFSKGMRQKVGIAIALAKNADVILMDEPTSGLDPRATDEFSRIVRELAVQGKSILIATHDIFNAVGIAKHVGIMKEGALVEIVEASQVTPESLQSLYLETI